MHEKENLLDRFKRWYRRQPEVVVFQPIKIDKTPQPVPFEVRLEHRKVKGFILRQDEDSRALSPRGSSMHVSVPSKWVELLPSELKPFLVQVQNHVGIAYLPQESLSR